jgi:hypothetical protein
MSKGKDRTVYKRPEGWVNKRNDADRASGIHKKQSDAVKEAGDMLRRQGGGELTIIGENKQIRSKDTIAPGRDPYPPRDKEH